MNPFRQKLTPFEILKLKQDGSKSSTIDKEHKQDVIKFLQGVYPFSKLDPKILVAEVWPGLHAKTFYEGDVLKSYDQHALDLYIIFDGEASVITRPAKH